jgi:hypothetical protein
MRRPSAELVITSLTRALFLIGILLALPFIIAGYLGAIGDRK